ncbi:MAG: 23S rRNA (uracil(1939)-C(5))-methyltransferase RlmD [Thermodesulfobacteriota bacterium]
MTKEIEITSLTYGGRGLGRIDGKVVFVPFAVPGDVLKVEITKEKKSFAEGEIAEIVKPSEDRIEPRCAVFGTCGGCTWQNIKYEKQLEWKARIFTETLERIGGVEFDKSLVKVEADEPYNYRSRARFQIDGSKWGFFAASSHTVVDIESCPLLDDRLNESYAAIKDFLKTRKHSLVSIELALSERDGMAVASFYSTGSFSFKPDELLASIDSLKGYELFRSKSKGARPSIGDTSFKKVSSSGDRELLLKVSGMDFKAAIGSFTQVNPKMNDLLIEKLLEISDIKGVERVLDLFCGIGNLTIPLAKLAADTQGVESDKRAVKYARANSAQEGIGVVRFDADDAGKWLKNKEIKSLARPSWDVVILDPPRGGDLETVKSIIKLAPRKIIYVSCSPPTLARDISFLRDNGYGLFGSVVLDMFPQTFHIESVVGLERV